MSTFYIQYYNTLNYPLLTVLGIGGRNIDDIGKTDLIQSHFMRLSQVRILAIVRVVFFHHFILYMYRCSENCLFTLLFHTIYIRANCSLPSGVVVFR